MSTIHTKLIAVTGAVSCLGLAALPFGYATASETADFEFAATVSKSISVSVDSSTVSAGDVTPGGAVTTASSVVTVSSNASGYTLTVVDADSNNSLCQDAECNTYIPATTTGNAVETGKSAWGIKASAEDGTIASAYGTDAYAAVPITSAATLKTFSGQATNDTTNVTYGFSAKVDQPSGEYTDTVTYTAQAS